MGDGFVGLDDKKKILEDDLSLKKKKKKKKIDMHHLRPKKKKRQHQQHPHPQNANHDPVHIVWQSLLKSCQIYQI